MNNKKIWDYRVVCSERYHPSDDNSLSEYDKSYSIQEIYYDDDGQPMAQTIDLTIEGDTITGMRMQLQKMISCLGQPVLDESDIIPTPGVKVKPGETDGLEVGPWEGMVHTDENNDKYIYESPDGGKTLYRRKFGDKIRENMENLRTGKKTSTEKGL